MHVRSETEALALLAPIPRSLFAPSRRRRLLETLLRRDRAVVAGAVARRIAARGWLLDVTAVSLRVFGRIAATICAASDYPAAVAAAIESVVEACAAESRDGRDDGLPPPGDPSLLGSADAARAIASAFNRLAERERLALYRLAVLRESVSEAAAALRLPEAAVAAGARRALLRILDLLDRLAPKNDDLP